MPEFGLILALMAIVTIVALITMQEQIAGIMSKIDGNLVNAKQNISSGG